MQCNWMMLNHHKKIQLWFKLQKLKFTRDTKGVRGCFCPTHSVAKVFRVNEPVMILEHDALTADPYS